MPPDEYDHNLVDEADQSHDRVNNNIRKLQSLKRKITSKKRRNSIKNLVEGIDAHVAQN